MGYAMLWHRHSKLLIGNRLTNIIGYRLWTKTKTRTRKGLQLDLAGGYLLTSQIAFFPSIEGKDFSLVKISINTEKLAFELQLAAPKPRPLSTSLFGS
jgi:hypothetical protein